MKKFLLLSAIFLSQFITTEIQGSNNGSINGSNFDIEGRVAYQYPTTERLRDVYGKNGWAEYQIEASMPFSFLWSSCCGSPCKSPCISPWVGFFNVGYFQKRNHPKCHPTRLCGEDGFCPHSKAKMESWLLTAGAKYYFDCFRCIRPYLGFGIGAQGVRHKDSSQFKIGSNHFHERSRTDKWGFAVLAKSGIEYEIMCIYSLMDLSITRMRGSAEITAAALATS